MILFLITRRSKMLKIKVLLLISSICFISVLHGMDGDERKIRVGEIIPIKVLQTDYRESYPWNYREVAEDKIERLELQQKILSRHELLPRLSKPEGAEWLTFTFKAIAA